MGIDDEVGPELTKLRWVGRRVGRVCLAMFIESFEPFVSYTSLVAAPLIMCPKLTSCGVGNKRFVLPGHDDGRLHVLRAKLTVVPS